MISAVMLGWVKVAFGIELCNFKSVLASTNPNILLFKNRLQSTMGKIRKLKSRHHKCLECAYTANFASRSY